MSIKYFEIGPFSLVMAAMRKSGRRRPTAIVIEAEKKSRPRPMTSAAYCPACKSEIRITGECKPLPNWARDGVFKASLKCERHECDWGGWGNCALVEIIR